MTMNNINVNSSIRDLTTIKSNIRQAIKEIGLDLDVLNDKGFGRMYARAFKDVLRYNITEKSWYYYNGKVWKEDKEDITAKNLAKLFSDEILVYGEELNLSEGVTKKINGLTSMAKRNTMVNDAKCECTVKTEEFDTDIYLLNLQNGTMDLRTFELKPHNAEDMLSKICNVSYEPNTRCARWEQFIEEIMEGDKEKADFLQRALGNCLTGDTREEELYILYGATSRNGKSTLLETVSHLLGGSDGYSVNVATTTFSGKRERSATSQSGDIARLAGARMAVTSELPQNMLVNAEMLKELTGQDKITARMMYKSEIEFMPQFKLFINTNYLPRITDDKLFESDRVNVIEFNKHFTEEERDKTLKTTLKEEQNLIGILNWLLTGLKKVWENGMTPPLVIKEATARFREDCDKIGCFLKDSLEYTGKNMTMKDLYDVYKQWTSDNGYGCEGKYNFKSALESKNMLQKSGTVNGNTYSNVIIGYTLKAEYQSKNTHTQTEYTPRPQRTEVQDPTDVF